MPLPPGDIWSEEWYQSYVRCLFYMRYLSVICTNADPFPNWEKWWKGTYLKTQNRKKTHLFDGKCELVTYTGQENVSTSMSLPWKSFKSQSLVCFPLPCQSTCKGLCQNRASISMGAWEVILRSVHVDLSHTYSMKWETD